MKKRVTLILFMFMFCFVSIDNLQAKSTYSCNKEVPVDGYITCSVTVDNDAVKIESDGNVNIYDLKGEKYSKISDYQAVFYESGTVVFGPADDKYSKYIISLLTEDGRPYGSDTRVNVIAKTTVKSTTTTTTKSLSSNNYLSTITVDGEEIENFSKNTSKYFVKVENDVSTISIEAEAEDEKAKVEIDGPDTLKIGDNEYTISVTSENDTTKFYKVIVTRKEADESSNTDIDNIKVKGYNLNFDKNSKTFYLSINKNTTKLNIEVTLDDEKSNYEIKGNENLKDGSIVKIIVTAEDGVTTKTYTITVTRETAEETEEPEEEIPEEQPEENTEVVNGSSIFGLSSLEIDGIELSPKFSTEVYEYTAKLVGDKERVEVNANATEENAKIEITGNEGLKEGESIICVYDSTGFLYYRNCLSFRKALDTQAAITDFIVNEVDHYTSVAYPGMHISFLAGNSGMVYGSDEGIGLEPAITFAYDYRGIVGTEHHLVVTDWQNQTYSSLTITDIYIEVNGYTVHPMTSGGVVDFFTPVFTE